MKRHRTGGTRLDWRLGLACLVLVAVQARACDTPVYQWALDQWAPDLYDVTVFHRGPLTPDQQALVERLGPKADDASAAADGTPCPNLRVREIDVSSPLDDAMQALWEPHSAEDLPLMVLRYPHSPPRRPDLWSGPLTEANVASLADSPKRQDLAKRIASGDAAVWVFLEIGDPEKDDPAFKTITNELANLRKETAGDGPIAYQQRPMVSDAFDTVNLSAVRVRRDDPAEQVFVEMLLGTESDLKSFNEPLAFPVFGRGRALYALVGAGITPANIKEAILFLATACTCIVKDQNPGADLLMATDWTAVLRDRPVPVAAPPSSPRETPVLEQQLAEVSSPHLLRNVLAGLAAAFIGVVAATVVLARRKG